MYKYNIEGNQQQKLNKKKTNKIYTKRATTYKKFKILYLLISWDVVSINHPTYLLFAHLDKQVLKKQPTY